MIRLNRDRVGRHKGALLTRQLALVFTLAGVSSVEAAVSLDRTRAIMTGEEKSISLNVSNESQRYPYLAQGWMENAESEKITAPLIVLPPVQRIEAGAKSQVKIQALPRISALPQDRESLFYFNLREIPPKSHKPNTLQLALQTRIKFFYRPSAIIPTREQQNNPWQAKLTLTRHGDTYTVNNPTPYYVTVVDASPSKEAKSVAGFEAFMIAPKNSLVMGGSAASLGRAPVLAYINDYGGRVSLTFTCQGDDCHVDTNAK